MEILRKRIRLVVVPEDFEGTEYTNTHNCPIAKALKKRGYDYISVGNIGITIDDAEYKMDIKDDEKVRAMALTAGHSIGGNGDVDPKPIKRTVIMLDRIY